MNLDQITAAYGEANAKAWLRLIRERESSQDDSAYTVINGGAHFDAPPWRHPWHGIPTTQGARASGAYQYLGTTWSRVADALGFGEDFSPVNQDLGALFLTSGRGALDLVLRGDVVGACVKCRPEWTSLPGAAEASAGWTMERALDVFRHWGGTVAGEQSEEAQPAPVATPQQRHGGSMGGLALVLPLVQSLIGVFSGRGQMTVGPVVPATPAQMPASGDPKYDAILQIVNGIMSSALAANGHPDPASATDAERIKATAAVLASPPLIQKVEDDALTRLDHMSPFLDKLQTYQQQEWQASEDSMDRAAARNVSTYDMTRPLVYSALGAGGVILVALMSALIIYALNKQALPEMLLTLIVQTVTGVLGFIALLFSFRFGSSRSSAAKDEVVAQLATVRKNA